MLDPSASDAADRTRRAIGELGLRGLCLFPAMHHVPLSDSRVQEVVENRRGPSGTAVFVHCGVLSVGVRASSVCPASSICGWAIRSAWLDWRLPIPTCRSSFRTSAPALFREALDGGGYLREHPPRHVQLEQLDALHARL
jgi:hypothetical protein